MSVFGSGLRPGRNRFPKCFTWFYYNTDKDCVEPVPPGFVPALDPQFLDINAPEEESDKNSDDKSENKGDEAPGEGGGE